MKRVAATILGIAIVCMPLTAGASTVRQQVVHWGKKVYPILLDISKYEGKLGRDIQIPHNPNVAGDGLFFYLDGQKLKKLENAPLPPLSATTKDIVKNVTNLGNDLVSYRLQPTLTALTSALNAEKAINGDITTLAALIKSYDASLG